MPDSFWNVVVVSLLLKFALCRNLLRIPTEWLNLIFTCVICLFQYKYPSINTQRYLTERVGRSLLPSSLNLKLQSVFRFLGLDMPSSVLFLLRVSLFVLNQFERFNKSFLICFDILSDGFDCMILVTFAKRYASEYLMLLSTSYT